VGVDEISKYFLLSEKQVNQLELLMPLYQEWNAKINVISRKDISNLYVHHVLHSLSILKFIVPESGNKIVDLGTGGGFPGIPLAILLPDIRFLLVDSIIKKVKVAEAVSNSLGLTNVETSVCRVEDIKERKFNFAVSRAVGSAAQILKWSSNLFIKESAGINSNGHIILKGGKLTEDIACLKREKHAFQIIPISRYFPHPYFTNKFILYTPVFQGTVK